MDSFMTFLWVYAYNLRWPIATVSLLIAVICVAVTLHGMRVREGTRFGDPENTDARWRQSASVQGGILSALLAALVWAIPAPNYDVRYVDRPVEKRVQVPVYRGIKIERRAPTYVEFYNTCVASITGNHTDDELKQCHDQSLAAMQASGPQPAVVYRVKKVHDSYSDIFAKCNSDFQIGENNTNPAAIRNERMKICYRVAIDGSRDR